MAGRRTIFYGVLVALAVFAAPAVFLWARTMVYWWSAPGNGDFARGWITGQLRDSANHSEFRSQYEPRMHSMNIIPNCDEVNAEPPKHWSKLHQKIVESLGASYQFDVLWDQYEIAEGVNLERKYSVNDMALLIACIEATPFGNTCRTRVNEVRWNSGNSEKSLLKSRVLSKVDGKICITYPSINFKSQDQK
jgi:hypothetical protein